MTKRTRSDEIEAVGDMLFRRPGAAAPAPAAAPPATEEAAGDHAAHPTAHAPGSRLQSHPATVAGTERRARRDVFDLDPRRILERGPYIREWDEEGEEFERLVAAVAERREVDTPIWVRSEGPTGQRRFLLVAGRGRLKAALRNGLALVPVRDLGELSDQESIARQAEENLHRRNMSPGETAFAMWLMHVHGGSVTEIARRVQRDKGYVSVMVKVGEAMQQLPPADRVALNRQGALQVRQCQAIAALPSVDERVAELRRLLTLPVDAGGVVQHNDHSDEAYRRPDPGARNDSDNAADGTSPVQRAATRRATVDATPFYAKPIRHGRTFRMRWVQDDLRRDPVALAEGYVAAMRAEGEQMLAALDRLERESGKRGQGTDPAALARARQALAAIVRSRA